LKTIEILKYFNFGKLLLNTQIEEDFGKAYDTLKELHFNPKTKKNLQLKKTPINNYFEMLTFKNKEKQGLNFKNVNENEGNKYSIQIRISNLDFSKIYKRLERNRDQFYLFKRLILAHLKRPNSVYEFKKFYSILLY